MLEDAADGLRIGVDGGGGGCGGGWRGGGWWEAGVEDERAADAGDLVTEDVVGSAEGLFGLRGRGDDGWVVGVEEPGVAEGGPEGGDVGGVQLAGVGWEDGFACAVADGGAEDPVGLDDEACGAVGEGDVGDAALAVGGVGDEGLGGGLSVAGGGDDCAGAEAGERRLDGEAELEVGWRGFALGGGVEARGGGGSAAGGGGEECEGERDRGGEGRESAWERGARVDHGGESIARGRGRVRMKARGVRRCRAFRRRRSSRWGLRRVRWR